MKLRCSLNGANFVFKRRAFLLMESCLALMIVVLASQVLFFCIAQSQVAQKQVERRVDRAYASYVLKRTKLGTIQAHGHVYQLAGQKIVDRTEGKTYEVK